jgi:anti-anti-sigma factor
MIAMPAIRVLRPQPGAAVVECAGQLDIASAPDLDVHLEDLASDNELVVVDLSEAEFVDSSIVQCLARAHRRSREQRTQFRLQLGTAPNVERALELSGMLELLDIARTRSAALRLPPVEERMDVTLVGRVEQVIYSYRGQEIRTTTGTRAAVEELVARNAALEEIVCQLASEVERLAARLERTISQFDRPANSYSVRCAEL